MALTFIAGFIVGVCLAPLVVSNLPFEIRRKDRPEIEKIDVPDKLEEDFRILD